MPFKCNRMEWKTREMYIISIKINLNMTHIRRMCELFAERSQSCARQSGLDIVARRIKLLLNRINSINMREQWEIEWEKRAETHTRTILINKWVYGFYGFESVRIEHRPNQKNAHCKCGSATNRNREGECLDICTNRVFILSEWVV